jgi:hypothetical protein
MLQRISLHVVPGGAGHLHDHRVMSAPVVSAKWMLLPFMSMLVSLEDGRHLFVPALINDLRPMHLKQLTVPHTQ